MSVFSKRQRTATVRRMRLPVLLILSACFPLQGGERPSRAPAVSAAARTVLLLTNGRLVQGNIYRDANGYVVELPNGRMMIPARQVQLEAQSAHQAYVKLRDTIPPQALNQHLLLATWCVTNELYDEARREIETVLKVDPDHRTARRMLRRLEALIAGPKRSQPAKKASLHERLAAPEVTALAGLSPRVARDFVGKVQPILMNSCALSGCHGPRTDNGLRLAMVHLQVGNRRGISERNLSTVLRFIDLRRPEQSPLLLKPLGNHGRRGRPVFRGRSGARQLAELRRWVNRLAAENRPLNTGRSDLPPSEPVPASGSESRPSESEERPLISPPVSHPQNLRSQNPFALPQEPVPVPTRHGFGVRRTPLSYQLTPAMKAARARLRRQQPVGDSSRPDRSAPRTNRNGPERPAAPSTGSDPFDPAEFNRANSSRFSPVAPAARTRRNRSGPFAPPSPRAFQFPRGSFR